MNKAICVFAMMWLACGPLWADTVTVTPQNADSAVMFKLVHDLGYTVGQFKDFTATIQRGDDPARIDNLKAEVTVESLDTHNAFRDQGLISPLFLDAAQFPQAVFESTQVTQESIIGTLTVKGVSRPVAFQRTNHNGLLRLTATINRQDFGITYNAQRPDKKKVIGDAVDLIVDLKM